MSQHPALPGHRREFFPAVLIGYDAVSGLAWAEAVATRRPVGTCGKQLASGKTCGRSLSPGQPYEVGRTVWYPAECAAGHETAAHGPRPEKPKKGT